MRGFLYLAVTVLVAIAIGVGVTAATTSERVYGPPGARFTVAFPSRVQEQSLKLPALDAGMDYYSDGPYTGRPPNESRDSNGVSAQYISNGVSSHGLRALVLRFKGGLGIRFRAAAKGDYRAGQWFPTHQTWTAMRGDALHRGADCRAQPGSMDSVIDG